MARTTGKAPLARPGHDRGPRLEEVTRFLLEALDSVVAFGHAQGQVRADRDPIAIFPEARAQIRRLASFSATAFLTVTDSAEFTVVDCEPESERTSLLEDVEAAIGRRAFGWAVIGNRVVTASSARAGQTLVLHPLKSGAHVVGMFAGRLSEDDALGLAPAGSSLLSLILFSAAQAFDNATLYRHVEGHAQHLEQRVEARTEELERAYEELSKTKDQLVQSQKIEAIGRLAGGIAHDFNNLLIVITGHAQMLHEALPAGDARRRHVDMIGQTAGRAAALTQQLLAFSRKQALQPSLLDLNAVVLNLEQMLRRLIGEHIELVSACGSAAGHVRVDRSQLEQVIVNLAVNARDAMPGGGRLTLRTANADLDADFVRLHPGARPGPFVTLEVSDTGEGMDADVRAHLFEPFFTTKGVGKGTGLGLATVYGIVKQSDGYIDVESEPGQGARFTIYLPRVPAPDAPRLPVMSDGAPGTSVGARTILVVEDEEAVRSLVCDMLSMHGYDVLEAAHGLEALETFERRAGPIDLVVTDVVMPQMGGRQLADRLAAMRPGTRVLFVSGYPADAVSAEGVSVPGTAFLQKPFTAGALLGEVKRLLERT